MTSENGIRKEIYNSIRAISVESMCLCGIMTRPEAVEMLKSIPDEEVSFVSDVVEHLHTAGYIVQNMSVDDMHKAYDELCVLDPSKMGFVMQFSIPDGDECNRISIEIDIPSLRYYRQYMTDDERKITSSVPVASDGIVKMMQYVNAIVSAYDRRNRSVDESDNK